MGGGRSLHVASETTNRSMLLKARRAAHNGSLCSEAHKGAGQSAVLGGVSRQGDGHSLCSEVHRGVGQSAVLGGVPRRGD